MAANENKMSRMESLAKVVGGMTCPIMRAGVAF